MKTRRPRAFTMMEVMVVVVLLGIIAAAALPMMRDSASTTLRAAATMLVADLEFVRSECLARSDDPRLLILLADGSGYRIAAASSPDTPITDPMSRTPYAIRFGVGRGAVLAGTQIVATQVGGDDRLSFGLYGNLDQTTPATITLALQDRSVTVTVHPTTGLATIGDLQPR